MLRLLALLAAFVWLHGAVANRFAESGSRTEASLTAICSDTGCVAAGEQITTDEQITSDNPCDNHKAALRIRRMTSGVRPATLPAAGATAAMLPAWRIGAPGKRRPSAPVPQRRALLCIYRI